MTDRSRFGRRLAFVGSCLGIFALALLARMFTLTALEGERRADKAQRMTCSETDLVSFRGRVVDRNGATLAASLSTRSVSRSSTKYRYDPFHAALLAPVLGLERGRVDGLLKGKPGKFQWLARRVSLDVAAAASRLGIAGLEVHTSQSEIQRRTYPQGRLASHVVGHTNSYSKAMEGVELEFDEYIKGKPVSVRVCRDIHKRPFYNESDLAGVNWGDTVHLTLDSNLQSIAARELAAALEEFDAQSGSVVIVEPSTGNVLAMVSLPDYDSNRPWLSEPADRRNRAVTDNFEPGSTMKPFLVAAALDSGVVSEEDSFFCEDGLWRYGGRPIHDYHPHGDLLVPEIIKYSSNICSAKIGVELGAERLHDYLERFGFGSRSGVRLPGEVSGQLAAAASWRPVRLANISFGQGMGSTALQLAVGFATLANGGVRMKPRLVKTVVAADGTVKVPDETVVEGRAVSKQVAASVTAMLESVVEPGGTALRAAVDGVRVAGKTGTAQQIGEDRTYVNGWWASVFAGYLPADDPRLAMAVVVNRPVHNHFGGVVSAPVFRRIAESGLDYLKIRRDQPREEKPVMVRLRRRVRPQAEQAGGKDLMPDLEGLSMRSALHMLDGCDCDIAAIGSGYVADQQPAAGTRLAAATPVRLQLLPELQP